LLLPQYLGQLGQPVAAAAHRQAAKSGGQHPAPSYWPADGSACCPG
jgi:hypothetical protein